MWTTLFSSSSSYDAHQDHINHHPIKACVNRIWMSVRIRQQSVLRLTSINFRVGVPVFSLSPACSLSVPVNLLGRLPWLLIGSGSCHSSLSDMTPTYPLPVKFLLADKRTLKGVNGNLSFALCICCHFTRFDLLYLLFVYAKILCVFVLTFLILIWFAILFGLICYFVTRMALLFDFWWAYTLWRLLFTKRKADREDVVRLPLCNI